MSKTLREDLEERIRVHDLMMSYFSMSPWTPAMFAQLICGIQPVPQCTEIPDSACQLRRADLPATPDQLKRAREILARIISDYTDDDCEVPSDLTPLDFFEWTEETYRYLSPLSRPDWFEYFISFFRFHSESSCLNPAPIELIKRAYELECFASVVGAQTTPQGQTNDVTRPSYSKRVAELIDEGKCRTPIAGPIALAMDKATNPYSIGEIWVHLCEMAMNGNPLLRFTGPMSFEVYRVVGKPKPYSRNNLRAVLARLRIALNEK